MNKSALRQFFRKKRKALSQIQQQKAALRLAAQLASHDDFRNAKKIGFYIASDGEISPKVLLAQAQRKKKHCYFPALTQNGEMVFRRYDGSTLLEKHALGFLQPTSESKTIDVKKLDLVLVPLVAFSSQGERLGMGGGFYDKTFAFKKKHPHFGPILLGLAHHCQKAHKIITQSWDIQLNAICTDKRVYHSKKIGKAESKSG